MGLIASGGTLTNVTTNSPKAVLDMGKQFVVLS
jgi:hypothetical protein